MKKNIFKILSVSLIFACAGMLSSCNKDSYENDGGYEGSISLNIDTDDSSTTKTPGYDIDDYEILVYKEGKQYARFLKYSDMPQPFRLKEGDYELKAVGGNDHAVAYDSPYFVGTEPFSVEYNSVTPVSVTCYLGNVKMSFATDAEFDAAFSDYNVIITTPYRTVENPFVVPKVNVGKEDKTVYLRPGDIKLKLNLTKRSNEETFTYGLPIITDVEPRQHYRITFTSDHPGTGVSVLIEEEFNEVERTLTLSSEYLESDPPMALAAFDNTSPVVVPYQMPDDTSIMVLLKSDEGIKDLVIDIDAPEQELSSRGIPSQVKFSEITPEIKSALNEWGLEWTNEIIGTRVSRLYFTDMLANLNLTESNGAAEYSFKVNIVDDLDNESPELPFTFRVEPLQFSMPEITGGDAWATFAYITAIGESDVTVGDVSKMNFIYEISPEGSGDWTEIPMGTSTEYCQGALTPGASYSVRAKYKQFTSEEVTFTTENIAHMPNSDLEEWHNRWVYKGGSALWIKSVDVYEWFVNASDDYETFWGTNNPRTTSQRSGQSMDYTSYSGTLPTDDSRSGRAAKITTMGWGEGTTMVSTGNVVKNISSGMLFTGTCDAGGNLSLGRPFTSRPTKLSFWYKYAPYNGNSYQAYISVQNRDNGTVELGRAEISDGMPQDTYKNTVLEIQYDNEHRHLKATHIEVMFKSSAGSLSKSDVANIWGSVGAFNGYTDSRYEGSRLQIDDIELIYTK